MLRCMGLRLHLNEHLGPVYALRVNVSRVANKWWLYKWVASMCLTLLSLHLLWFGGKFIPSVSVARSAGNDARLTCFNGFNLFGGDGIGVAAVSSEMALTGRSHSDNSNPLSASLHSRPFFSCLTSFFTQVSPSFSLTLFLVPTSPVFHLSACLWLLSPFSRMYFWESASRDCLDSGHSEELHQTSVVFYIFSLPLSLLLLWIRNNVHVFVHVLPHTFLFHLYLQTSSPSLPSSLCPLGIELLIAFSVWKSLTSFSFVRTLWSNSVSSCCKGRSTLKAKDSDWTPWNSAIAQALLSVSHRPGTKVTVTISQRTLL